MSNKKLTFEQAVKSGKDFRCVETGEEFFRKNESIKHETSVLLTNRGELKIFSINWLDQTFEIVEVKKELTASEIKEAFFESVRENPHSVWVHIAKELTKRLGF
jgi:hypothetical protein